MYYIQAYVWRMVEVVFICSVLVSNCMVREIYVYGNGRQLSPLKNKQLLVLNIFSSTSKYIHLFVQFAFNTYNLGFIEVVFIKRKF